MNPYYCTLISTEIKIDVQHRFLRARPSQWQIKNHYGETPGSTHESILSRLHIIHVCMYVWLLPDDPAVRHDWWLLLHRVLGLHHAAPLLFSVPISPVLLQTGHSFPAPKIPQFSPHVPCQSVQCRPQASCTGLTSPKACAAQRIDFISPSLTLSLLYPVALCQIVSLTEKKS